MPTISPTRASCFRRIISLSEYGRNSCNSQGPRESRDEESFARPLPFAAVRAAAVGCAAPSPEACRGAVAHNAGPCSASSRRAGPAGPQTAARTRRGVVAHLQAMGEGCDVAAGSLELGVELVGVHAGTTLYPLPSGESTGTTRLVGTTSIPAAIRSSGRLPCLDRARSGRG
jgi:hypothetical protein